MTGRWRPLEGSPLVSLVQGLSRVPAGWCYALLLAAFVAEGTSLPLIHLPSAVMFLASAYLITTGKTSLVVTILVAATGSTIGGLITYRLGRRLAVTGSAGDGSGEDALTTTTDAPGAVRSLGLRTDPQRQRWVRHLVVRYGALFAMASRWLGLLRPAALLATGMARINPWKVGPALFAGALVYCTVYQLAANEVAVASMRLLGQVDLPWILLSALVLALAWGAGLFVLRRIRL